MILGNTTQEIQNAVMNVEYITNPEYVTITTTTSFEINTFVVIFVILFACIGYCFTWWSIINWGFK